MKQNWIKISKIGRDFEICEIFDKFVQNWPSSENVSNSANIEDIGVCFFANILFFIVELNCKIKIGDKLKSEGRKKIGRGGTLF